MHPPLADPDAHSLRAAEGWFELGNLAEAKAELRRVRKLYRRHPDVLELRWAMAAGRQQWSRALAFARALVSEAPERASGWLHQAYSLRRAPKGGLKQAWDALLPTFKMFPREPIIPYNLACYACQLQDLVSARAWLKCAALIGGKEAVMKMASADADLEPLWPELDRL